MADSLLTLDLTESTRFAYSTLRPEDRRLVDAWFDHLRNWRNDEYVRAHSKRLMQDDEVYSFQTSNFDFVIAFRIAGNQVTVLSIFSKDTVRAFETTAEHSAS